MNFALGIKNNEYIGVVLLRDSAGRLVGSLRATSSPADEEDLVLWIINLALEVNKLNSYPITLIQGSSYGINILTSNEEECPVDKVYARRRILDSCPLVVFQRIPLQLNGAALALLFTMQSHAFTSRQILSKALRLQLHADTSQPSYCLRSHSEIPISILACSRDDIDLPRESIRPFFRDDQIIHHVPPLSVQSALLSSPGPGC